MEVKSTRYTVEYYSQTIWDEYFSDRRSFNTESEALAYIQELLKNPRTGQVYYTTTKEIGREKE